MITNTKPEVMKDKGPYGTTRSKSEDGKYTANPNRETETNADPFPDLILGKDTTKNSPDGIFDKKICEPLFEKIIKESYLDLYVNDAKEDQVTVFKKTTPLEDKMLGIDYFIGNAGRTEPLLLSEPEVEQRDLKTVTGGLGNLDFYERPKINVKLFKALKRRTLENGGIPVPDNLLKRKIHFTNSATKEEKERLKECLTERKQVYAYVIPYSEKKKNEITSLDDIKEAKAYIVPHSIIRERFEADKERNEEIISMFARGRIRDTMELIRKNFNVNPEYRSIDENNEQIRFIDPNTGYIYKLFCERKLSRDSSCSFSVQVPVSTLPMNQVSKILFNNN